MLLYSLILGLCVFEVHSVVQNVSCPVIVPRELDLKNLDGKWYMISIASEQSFQGDCAVVMFSHKTDNTTDISIGWVTNKTANFFNGSVALSIDPNSNSSTEGDLLVVKYTDQTQASYTFLALDYEHYAVIFSCTNNDDGNSSTYELWELSRTPQFKPRHEIKINEVLATYNLKDAPLLSYKNTKDTCLFSAGFLTNPSAIILATSAAIALLKILY